MRIDKKMNLVIPLVNDETKEEIAFVHSTPISSELFNKYYLVMGKAFARIYAEGLGFVGGPRIADKILRTVAEELGIWEGPFGVQKGLMEEIYRLTNIIVPDEKNGGWQYLGYYDAKKGDTFSESEISEVDGIICFFTLASHLHRKADFQKMVGTPLEMLDARIVSLDTTGFLTSLRKSKLLASTGETAAA